MIDKEKTFRNIDKIYNYVNNLNPKLIKNKLDLFRTIIKNNIRSGDLFIDKEKLLQWIENYKFQCEDNWYVIDYNRLIEYVKENFNDLFIRCPLCGTNTEFSWEKLKENEEELWCNHCNRGLFIISRKKEQGNFNEDYSCKTCKHFSNGCYHKAPCISCTRNNGFSNNWKEVDKFYEREP